MMRKIIIGVFALTLFAASSVFAGECSCPTSALWGWAAYEPVPLPTPYEFNAWMGTWWTGTIIEQIIQVKKKIIGIGVLWTDPLGVPLWFQLWKPVLYAYECVCYA